MALFKFISSKSKIGIDIDTASIKIVELEKGGGRFNLLNYGIFELKSTDAGGQSMLKLPDDEIVWGIKEVIKQSKIQSKETTVSIPSFSTFSTVIEMPCLSKEDLSRAIPFEARKYIPIPLSEVSLDWSIVDIINEQPSGSMAGQPTVVEVFIAAVPKDETVRYQNIIKGAGLNLKALELENSAISRALLGNDLAPTAIINIGGRSTSIIIVDKGYERVGHNYEVGGFEITKSIARSLNVSIEKAEELKRKLGLRPIDENIVNEAMSSLIDMMALETKKTITNYEEAKNIKVSGVLLIGGMANMPNFAGYFQKKLEREVMLGNAFARIVYPEGLNAAIREISNTFCVAAGLAMRET